MRKGLFLVLGLILVSCVAIRPYDVEHSFSTEISVLPNVPSTTIFLEFVPDAYYQTVINVALQNQIPVYYFAKLIHVESAFNPRAINKSNRNGSYDYGIAQLNSVYIDEFAFRYGYTTLDPFDPYTSLEVAGKHLRTLYNNTGSWEKAIAAYNCGLTAVLKGRIPSSTVQYVQRIMKEDA
jgi:soluble lytic murein transglycosylase-like protein